MNFSGVKMNRREFLRKCAATAGTVTFLHGSVAGGGTLLSNKKVEVRLQRGNLPNIIFIMADDLGYGEVGCYGQQYIQTPKIDLLAAQGMRFTQVYSGSPVCSPSRSVLMTGQHTGHTRVRDNFAAVGGVGPEHRPVLEYEDITVAEVLRQAGYATWISGKWGLGEPGTSGVPTRQGYDEWLGFLNNNRADHYFTEYLWRNEEKYYLEGNLNGERNQYVLDVFTDFALDFIRSNKDRPFFLYLPYTTPHALYEVPNVEPYADKPWTAFEKTYAAMITRMDKEVGRIMNLLRELGIDENTIVFFTSDNGASGNVSGTRFDSWGVFRGKKGSVYEGGLRVPMIVRWPGKVPAGRVSDKVWYFADVLPTLGELAGVRAPSNIDGVSVLQTLLGREQDLNGRFLYWEKPAGSIRQAVRLDDWKGVRYGLNGSLELYNLKTDVSETTNVASQHPGVVVQIENYLETARTESPMWPNS